jgi:hypothetical protein
MLKSYEATMENGQIHWLTERPTVSSSRVIVTVLVDDVLPVVKRRRVAPPSIAGKGRTLGDIVSPIIDEQDWECLKSLHSICSKKYERGIAMANYSFL